MQTYRKSIAAAAVPLLVSAAMWMLTGEINAPELSLALTGFLTAVAVYETPNAPEG